MNNKFSFGGDFFGNKKSGKKWVWGSRLTNFALTTRMLASLRIGLCLRIQASQSFSLFDAILQLNMNDIFSFVF